MASSELFTGLSILLATLAGGVLSVAVAGLLSIKLLGALAPRLIGFAVGALLAAALLHLLPEAAESLPAHDVGWVVLAGILVFFILEKLALWRHDHTGAETHPAGVMVVLGDGLHNFVDGILIAAAFLQDPALGVSTTLAVISHEIPQEAGDFMVLLASGHSRREALWLNLLSSSTAVLGGILGWLMLSHASAAIPYVLALAAASFIYVAVADLIPMLQQQRRPRDFVVQLSLLVMGLAVIGIGLGHDG